MKIRVKVDGLKEIQRAMEELPRATQKNVMKRVLMARAKPIAAMADNLVPVDRGVLQRSIKVFARSGSQGKAAFAKAMRSGATRKQAGQAARDANSAASTQQVVYVSTTKKLPHAHMQEFGTEKMAPNPFMRPAWDKHEPELLKGLAGDMWAEIKKAVARRARKAAKGT